MAKSWKITVETNKNFCGEGAGGAQFAHGQAVIASERLAEWFKDHKGYKVEEIKEKPAKPEKPAE